MSKAKKRKTITNGDIRPATPGSSFSSDDEGSMSGSLSGRMSVRKETEQRRRNMMNQHFDELVMMLSMITDRVNPKKMDKTSILEEVVRVVRQYYELDKCPQLSHMPEYKPGFFSRGDVFNFLLDALGAFLMFVSGNGRILYCSDLITSLTGHMPTRLVGQTIYDCVVPDDKHIVKAQFIPPCDVTGVPIVGSRIISFPPRKFSCSLKLYSNDPSSMSVSRNFTCMSYLRQWTEDTINYDEESGADLCPSNCILLLGKLSNTERPRDHSVTTNDVNFEFSMRVSKEGKILEVDKQASLLLGFTKKDIQGASFFDYIDPYHSEKIGEAIEMFLNKGLGVSQPYRLSSKGGQYIWVVSKGFLSYNPWNHKPDHVLLQSKVLGCDEVLPEYKFKLDSTKMPNPVEDYAPPKITEVLPTSSKVEEQQVIVTTAPVSTITTLNTQNQADSSFNTDSRQSLPPQLSSNQRGSSLFPSYSTNLLDSQSSFMNARQQDGGGTFESMAQQLERKNQELFEMQRRMLEQQQLFEQERRQFYQVTNRVMTYIGGKNEDQTNMQSYFNPMAIGMQQQPPLTIDKMSPSLSQADIEMPPSMKHSLSNSYDSQPPQLQQYILQQQHLPPVSIDPPPHTQQTPYPNSSIPLESFPSYNSSSSHQLGSVFPSTCTNNTVVTTLSYGYQQR